MAALQDGPVQRGSADPWRSPGPLQGKQGQSYSAFSTVLTFTLMLQEQWQVSCWVTQHQPRQRRQTLPAAVTFILRLQVLVRGKYAH